MRYVQFLPDGSFTEYHGAQDATDKPGYAEVSEDDPRLVVSKTPATPKVDPAIKALQDQITAIAQAVPAAEVAIQALPSADNVAKS